MDPEGMWHHALPGLDYFDEEAKCYSRLFEFCQVTFCHSRQGLRDFGKILQPFAFGTEQSIFFARVTWGLSQPISAR